MTERNVYRIICDVVLLASIALAPWWMVAVLAIVGALLFPRFYEIILAGAALDALYGFGAIPWATGVSLLSFVILQYTRGILRI